MVYLYVIELLEHYKVGDTIDFLFSVNEHLFQKNAALENKKKIRRHVHIRNVFHLEIQFLPY